MITEKSKQAYLMTAGTLLPAFVVVSLNMAIGKKAKLGMTDILLFAGASIIGGYYTAQLIHKQEA